MNYWQKALISGMTVLAMGGASYGQEISREQVKGLDEQVQEIKGDALSISAELAKLEEKLLYPSNTEVSVFISLKSGETFRLDSIDIQMDGKPVTHHLYTLKELEALRKGGVQKIYTGNVRTGDHDLQVQASGKTTGGSDFQKSEHFKVSKDVAPKIVEVSLASENMTFKDR
ncbi:MAG TPA: hypothetical protein VMM54_03540 [Nitrospirota bacterium]|nr:hypothetical protein [Nitrospirota bacterium]